MWQNIGLLADGEVLIAAIVVIVCVVARGFLGRIGGFSFEWLVDRFTADSREDERLFTGSSIEEAFVKEVENINPLRELEITSVDYDHTEGGSLVIEYRSELRERLEVRGEVENIGYAFASALSETTHPCGELVVNVLNEDQIPIAWYHVDQDWAESFNSGDIDEVEYLSRIMNTFQWADGEDDW